MIKRRNPFHIGLFVLALSVLALYGCADMPIIEPPPGEDMPIGDAQVVLGPYLTSADGMQPYMRFVSSRRTVAGVQAITGDRKYVSRQASFSLFHSLAIPELEGYTKPYRLWLGDQDGGAWGIRGLPRRGMAASVGFSGGSVAANRLYATGNVLRMLDLNAVVFTSPPFPGGVPDQPVDWETMFFRPLGDKIAFGPMWFAPGLGLPSELFPENAAEGGYWKRDMGALRIIGMDARAFSFETSRKAILDRLRRDLDPGHTERAWTVVVLSRTAFDARAADGRILGALGEIMERGGVDLVIGAGDYYLRTMPFSSGGQGLTHYVSIADMPTAAPSAASARDYVAAISGVPHVARLWADEGTLEWRVVDLAGRTIDILTLESRRTPQERPLSLAMALDDAQSSLSLQREVLRITRQAAKAVPSPAERQMLALSFANPTTRVFSGTMRWTVPSGSGWQIEPMDMPFTLQPGQSAIARFAVEPGSNAVPAQLTVSVPDVGQSTEPLLLTRERVYDVQKAPEEIRVDARFRDKLYWRTLPVLGGFRTLSGDEPASRTEARVTADKNGLVVAVTMEAKNASQVNPPASDPEADRDGPVLEDESVEIFIDPRRDGRDFYHFAVNPRNVVLDASSRAGLSYNPAWRRVARFGRVGDVETWDVEMRIPWEALGLAGAPEQGEEWGFQIVRRDCADRRENMGRRRGKNYVEPPAEVSEWVPTGGDHTRPGLYGVLRFGDMTDAPEAADTGRRSSAPGMLIRGGGMLPGRLPTGTGGFIPPPSAPVPEPPAPDM